MWNVSCYWVKAKILDLRSQVECYCCTPYAEKKNRHLDAELKETMTGVLFDLHPYKRTV